MRYLLDTSIVIAAMKGHPLVRQRLERTPAANVLLSPVVLGELAFGARKSAHVARNEARVAELAAAFQVPPMDARASLHYGEVRARLERQGSPIGANDTWIAAHALALEAVLVTNNVREFSRVPSLMVENWTIEGA